MLIRLQKRFSWFAGGLVAVFSFLIFSNVSCTAQPPQSIALRSLREMSKKGQLPAESVVANLEARYPGSNVAALARLMRARIRMTNGDSAGAARLLDSPMFEQKTKVGDYALWLRGRALIGANNPLGAQKVFEDLVRKYPDSMRVRNARLLWANSLAKSGQIDRIETILQSLVEANDPDAILLLAQAFENASRQTKAIKFYRQVYFYGAGTKAGGKAKKWLEEHKEILTPRTSEESLARANNFFKKRQFKEATKALEEFIRLYPRKIDSGIWLKQLTSFARSRQLPKAKTAFNSIPRSAKEKREGYYELARGYAKVGQLNDARLAVNEMRQKFPRSKWTPKTLIELGFIARDQRRKLDELSFLKTAVTLYPNAIDVTKAQFELAWLEHEKKNFRVSSRMLTEHLARYVHKDNSYRGQAGYWAARDSERAGKVDEACALYDAVVYRYGSNWYGYLGLKRLTILRRNRKCRTKKKFPSDSLIPKAVANMKVVTVASETATAKEIKRAVKSEELSTIGLFDWALDELKEAKKSANNSPKINLALAKHYRLKGDNVGALLALKNSYPDYPQMFPEEMGREEWDIFYPLIHWNIIKYWAKQRNLDPYQVAGLIRQESIFDPNAKSGANAYGLMQLVVPTARMMARKYSKTSPSSIYGSTLYNPRLNIELGTAYMREQLSKYGRIEYMSVAYNAGPGRVVRWRRELPLQMDEFVEEIPFSETRGYVKGVIRNSAQYRKLYDMNGNFKPNVGTRALRGQIDKKRADQFAKENPEILVERKRKTAE